ncbi:unnamed protein product [Microthlaspi erraticum]|uniref:Uncharacterized protein n=1 Tax=Microthlaspi erraticum TaxID=1685480 RepID=A0A6D2JV04_9BRAS|nr:unnamed protein product [Microthlaspi erraticum]
MLHSQPLFSALISAWILFTGDPPPEIGAPPPLSGSCSLFSGGGYMGIHRAFKDEDLESLIYLTKAPCSFFSGALLEGIHGVCEDEALTSFLQPTGADCHGSAEATARIVNLTPMLSKIEIFDPPFLAHPPPQAFLPPSSTIASVTTGLVLGNSIILDDKPKIFKFIDSPAGVSSPAQCQKIKLLPWSSPPSNPILVMDPSSHFAFCSNTTPSFNDNFSTMFCLKWYVISGSSFVTFMHLWSDRLNFRLFIVKYTGSSAGNSSDFADMGFKVLSTYRHISNSTSAVVEYCQLTGVSLNSPLSFMEINFKSSTTSTALTASRALCLVRTLLIAKELEIRFKTI